ncbi:MAG: glycerol kinase [Gammaproteobacteria bacterium]|nr:glycerol kinase [Gammaproteobacteria bacterium]
MARRSSLFLALDQGGHASRALVFSTAGKLVAKAEKRIATRYPAANRVEHDPEALLASLRQVCSAVARQLGARANDVRCAGLATQRSTLVCWDRGTGRALSPVISWQDRRAARRLKILTPQAARVHSVTGLVLSPHYGASKLAWCLENLPAVRRARQQHQLAAGPLASFILANLLEEKPLWADPVNASRTLLWDYRSRDWSPELLKLFGIPAAILPVCVPNRHAFGHLPLGRYRIPLTVVTGDQPASLFANGKPQPHSVYVNIGTGAFIQKLHGTRPPQVSGMLGSVLWQDKKRARYVLEGTVNGAASALLWLRQRLKIREPRMLAQMPRWLNMNSDVPLFINGVAGLGSPYWVSDLRSHFIGRGPDAQKFVAVAESIVFLLHGNLQRMRRAHAPVQHIVVSGGLAQWNGLCQRLADLSGLPVRRPQMHEATARGVAWLLGARSPAATPAETFKPENNPALAQRYRRWQAALHQELRLRRSQRQR